MITFLLSTNLIMTLMFMLMKHPLSMGVVLLTQTIIISLITGNLYMNLWFSYILFLIMIGGMLILFMYMTSIASNEKFSLNMKMLIIPLPLPLIWLILSPYSKNLVSNNETLNSQKSIELLTTLNKFINFPLMMTLLFLMIYLLLALIATVKITNFKMGSIRQMN
uniref:NADH-ubiquinone oxidoreductase chain 6 n=1 Tax=Ulomoides dermestoides TaxID=1552300 RepID=A0A0U1XEY5_9CUCU|nr:NADH dehydrogenase subunit 6 [Ulomoides dermestoides]AIS67608.1 NADH dehydrogenase subunit 6 [Ulomoides dermestoides]